MAGKCLFSAPTEDTLEAFQEIRINLYQERRMSMKIFHINDPDWEWPTLELGSQGIREFPEDTRWLWGSYITNRATRTTDSYVYFVERGGLAVYSRDDFDEIKNRDPKDQIVHARLEVPCKEKLKRFPRMTAYGLRPCLCKPLFGDFECPIYSNSPVSSKEGGWTPFDWAIDTLKRKTVANYDDWLAKKKSNLMSQDSITRRTTPVYAGNKPEDGAGVGSDSGIPRAVLESPGSAHSNSLKDLIDSAPNIDIGIFVAMLSPHQRRTFTWMLAKYNLPSEQAHWAASAVRGETSLSYHDWKNR